MNLGEKIVSLRKNNGLTQEEMAVKLGVTRQTISNWELNETSPDIKQAKEISKLFNISLDELLDNNVQSLLINKVSNTERLAGIIINILKFFGFLIILWIVLMIVAFICFSVVRKGESSDTYLKSASLTCSIGKNKYIISIDDKNFVCADCDEQRKTELHGLIKSLNVEQSVVAIKNYFNQNNGTCE